ncbi:hypothetical protein Metlim_0152 [Methanoplanus limicola DSM 2279]|uniref:Uncharacterized protein n=1 Tax=Methanoplanus limicola DSM 2279 TaxID=937775 RepID=H1YZP3_9EURY|nr:hypothetical protein Metlim_0152 [Methanoplanus limicola DSM 2279]
MPPDFCYDILSNFRVFPVLQDNSLSLTFLIFSVACLNIIHQNINNKVAVIYWWSIICMLAPEKATDPISCDGGQLYIC